MLYPLLHGITFAASLASTHTMEQSKDNKFIPMTSVNSGSGKEVAPDVYYYTNQIVNLVFIGNAGTEGWVLVDAGMPKSGKEIVEAAQKRFGLIPPAAIVLTHGHFDHVGSLVHLLEVWPGVQVYAHLLEHPFLNGSQAYPEPDPTAEGGMLGKIASYYPNEPINVTEALQALPTDGSLPFLPDWKCVHVPGHSPGQVALFREKDRMLISADAFVTVRQDSMYKVLLQQKEVNGPPRYFTTNWTKAYESVRKLQALSPNHVIPGHGSAMHGDELVHGLENLLTNWNDLALPSHGKYVKPGDKR